MVSLSPKRPEYQRLVRFVSGARISEDGDSGAQLETIAVTYLSLASLIFIAIAVALVVVSACLAFDKILHPGLELAIAAANALSFASTLVLSLGWTASRKSVEHLQSLAQARGPNYAFFGRYLVPLVVLGTGALALFLMVGLFHAALKEEPLSYGVGVLLASFATNVIFVQLIFVRRSLKSSAIGG
jgi:hypothetical protein